VLGNFLCSGLASSSLLSVETLETEIVLHARNVPCAFFRRAFERFSPLLQILFRRSTPSPPLPPSRVCSSSAISAAPPLLDEELVSLRGPALEKAPGLRRTRSDFDWNYPGLIAQCGSRSDEQQKGRVRLSAIDFPVELRQFPF